MDTPDPPSYLQHLMKSSPDLLLLGHSNPDTISQPLDELPHLLYLDGNKKSKTILCESRLILSRSHVIQLKALELTPQLIPPGMGDISLEKQMRKLSPGEWR